ncbi:maleylpyruvate isomerase family mycothiol-dependent enzyme [Streptomyces sp. BI20]|uniref:maleylpyruvate isomerase family mycothiol-dependent enzyme n=1 Tax=Streptomyces sp. BI20 TaxID=3403460 RepID=UPI003C773C65
MTDHVHDLHALSEATDRLLNAVGKLDNASIAEESHLPDWTRGHVLAHLARNADALVNVLAGRPMYASAETREADIARDADRTVEVHLADLRATHAAFLAAAAVDQDWTREVELRNGVRDTAARLPFRRLVEIELHHVDLDLGYALADLPAPFVAAEIAFLADRWSAVPGLPATRLVIEADEVHEARELRTGAAGEPAVTVRGAAPALLGWLAGRGAKGADLTADGGPVPALPAL